MKNALFILLLACDVSGVFAPWIQPKPAAVVQQPQQVVAAPITYSIPSRATYGLPPQIVYEQPPQIVYPSAAPCLTCPSGVCASGQCVLGCPNGQCSSGLIAAPYGSCPNGQCGSCSSCQRGW